MENSRVRKAVDSVHINLSEWHIFLYFLPIKSSLDQAFVATAATDVRKGKKWWDSRLMMK